MDPVRIAELLEPFLATSLSSGQLAYISIYIDLLIRWNARINLTAVREPDQIVTRHFGESLFAARQLFPDPSATGRVVDVGSGAGFPGLPLKLWAPGLELTLSESSNKKATFLREIVRGLTLTNVNVFAGRAEDLPPASAGLVTLRAVERFESVLPVAARLVASAGRLALLIGESQVRGARELLPAFRWQQPIPVPLSAARVLLIGVRPAMN